MFSLFFSQFGNVNGPFRKRERSIWWVPLSTPAPSLKCICLPYICLLTCLVPRETLVCTEKSAIRHKCVTSVVHQITLKRGPFAVLGNAKHPHHGQELWLVVYGFVGQLMLIRIAVGVLNDRQKVFTCCNWGVEHCVCTVSFFYVGCVLTIGHVQDFACPIVPCDHHTSPDSCLSRTSFHNLSEPRYLTLEEKKIPRGDIDGMGDG